MKNEGLLLLGKQSMEIREIEMPRITPDQVLIKTEYVGICGSDLHYYADPDKVPKLRQWQLPILLGHESAGEVVAVGENVKHLQVGDKVAVEPGVPCGECEFCRSGRYNICPSLSFMSSPPNRGAFRRYFEYPANMAYKLPDEVTTLEGCLLEPLAVGLHGAARAGVGLGDNVVIIGAGCVGLALLLACKARGAAKVVSFGSLFCFPRLSDEDLTAIFAAAKDGGALTCADMKLIEGAAMEQFSQALKKLDYLFANEDEAAAFSGQGTPEDMADYFLSLGVGHVIVKLGGRGCLIKGGGECRRVPPFYVKPVDTTGAGDNFAAGFISALCRDLPFAECARFASATAAITVQSIGSSTGVKSMGQVLSFIENYPSKEGKKTT